MENEGSHSVDLLPFHQNSAAKSKNPAAMPIGCNSIPTKSVVLASIIMKTTDTMDTPGQRESADLTLPANDAPSFHVLPHLCAARIADFLDRSSQVRLAATCQTANRLVSDPILVPKRWPLKPVSLLCLEDGEPEPTSVIFSPNGSRLALFYPSKHEDAPGRMEVWDVGAGKLGFLEIERIHDNDMMISRKPVFSPDSEILLILGMDDEAAGTVRVVGNLSSMERGDLSYTDHWFHDSLSILSITFMDSDWISYVVASEANVKKRKVIREEIPGPENGQSNMATVTFSEPEILFEPDLALIPLSSVYLEYPNIMCASFNGQQKSTHLLASASLSRFYMFDAKTDSTFVICAPDILAHNPVFSREGLTLVAPCWDSCLAVYDCRDMETVSDFLPTVLRSDENDDGIGSYEYFSFLPGDDSKVLATYAWSDADNNNNNNEQRKLRVLDLENYGILSEGWNETTWQSMVAFQHPHIDLDFAAVGRLRVAHNHEEDFTNTRALIHKDNLQLVRRADEDDGEMALVSILPQGQGTTLRTAW